MRPYLVAALIGIMFAGCRQASPPDPSVGAKRACVDFVRERLRVPLSARFPDPAAFTAREGRPKAGASSAAAVAAEISSGLADAFAGAKLLDLQLKILGEEELARIEGLARSGDQEGVRTALKAVLTSRFERSDYIVTGYVDAQSGSGAMTRSKFVCATSAAGGKDWRQDGVALGY